MKKYRYETHLHTFPVSKCGRASVRESLEFYKKLGYAGVFITNHFIDANINCDRSLPYAERIEFYFSDYEEGVKIGKEIGLSVFHGIEGSYMGTHFLVYGLDKEWFLSHPEIEEQTRTEQLKFMADSGALIVHAHPFCEAKFVDHIRLFPRHVHGVEIYNAHLGKFANKMAKRYAKSYGLLKFAGSDNHDASKQKHLGGIKSKRPIIDEADFVKRAKNGEFSVFKLKLK